MTEKYTHIVHFSREFKEPPRKIKKYQSEVLYRCIREKKHDIEFNGMIFNYRKIEKIEEIKEISNHNNSASFSESQEREKKKDEEKMRRIFKEFKDCIEIYRSDKENIEFKSIFLEFCRKNFNTITFEIIREWGGVALFRDIVTESKGYENILNRYMQEVFYRPDAVRFKKYLKMS